MEAVLASTQIADFVDFRTDPARYRHWKLSFDGVIANLALDTKEDGGIRPGYKLKLNSYDLGVDIERHDALQRIRFKYPEARTVILASNKPRVLFRRKHLYAGTFEPRLESKFLQIHE